MEGGHTTCLPCSPLSLPSLIPGRGPEQDPRDGATQGLERGSQNHSAEGRHLAENWGLCDEPLDHGKVCYSSARFPAQQRFILNH